MQLLTARDLAVVQLVGDFGQLSSSHIGCLAFHDRSGTVLDRCLLRLVRRGLLRRAGRMESDLVKGGAGAFVYELGAKGWALLGRSGRWRMHGVNKHTLDVAACYVALVDAEVVLDVAGGSRLHSYIEVDRDSQRPNVIHSKLSTYLEAWYACAGAQFPRVLFVVPDEPRKRQVENAVCSLPEHDQALFSVRLLNTF